MCLDGVGAIYASQRLRSLRHPLRVVLTPRKRASALRHARSLQRSRERLIADLRGKLPLVPPSFEPVRERFLGALAGSLMDGSATDESRDPADRRNGIGHFEPDDPSRRAAMSEAVPERLGLNEDTEPDDVETLPDELV